MDALRFAVTLAAELIPLFLVISTVVYLVVERLTPARIRAVLGGRSRWLGVPLAAGIGALTPFCSCSTVPLVNGMKAAGIPVASLIAFLIASPLINPVAVALLGTAVGVEYAVLYTAVGVVFAMLAGVVVEWWHGAPLPGMPASGADVDGCGTGECAPRPSAARAMAAAPAGTGLSTAQPPVSSSCCATGAPAARAESALTRPISLAGFGTSPGSTLRRPRASNGSTWRRSLAAAFSRALADLRKLWLALALAIGVGAVIHGYVPAELLARVAGPENPWAVPAAAVLGVPIYASIVVLLPLGASLLAKGVGIGAVTAFLMGASGFSVPEGILLSRVLPTTLLLRVLAVFCVGVVAIGYAFQAIAG